MTITNKTMLHKMIEELKQAVANEENNAIVREHVRAVRLLCDVLLEEEQVNKQAEWKAMTGVVPEQETVKTKNNNRQVASQEKSHDEANGDSIFDF